MALLEIKTAGDPVLKAVSVPVDKITKRLRKLLDDMAETMYASDGVDSRLRRRRGQEKSLRLD